MRCNIHDFDIMEEGKEIGIAIGKEEGRSEAKLEAARNLLMENVTEDVIARCTGLELEKVYELAESLKNQE
ncbi:MAG: hypothetical protein J5798_03060 [Spirochaetaceae bacterium]|nr:hypothetical protein [Spirochaetaceae bacterium]